MPPVLHAPADRERSGRFGAIGLLARLTTSFPGSMRRALVLVVLVVLLPLLVVQSGIYWSWFQDRRQEEEQANLELAQAVGASFEAQIRDIRRTEFALGGALTRLMRESPELAADFLTDTEERYPFVRSFNWVDLKGAIAASSDGDAVGLSVADRAYFHSILSGREWDVSDVVPGRATGELTFIVAQRIDAPDHELQGLMTAAIEMDRLGELTLPRERGERGVITIFDRRGTLVLRSPAERVVHRDWRDDDPLLEGVLTNKGDQVGAFYSPLDGTEYIAARVPMRDLGWVAGAARPFGVAMSDVHRGLWLVAGLNLVVAVISVGGAATVSRLIIHRLRGLQQYAQAIGRGEMDHRTEVAGVLELQELADDFDRMGESIKQAQEELTRANTALEQRVADRTAELHDTVRSLEKEVQERIRAEQSLQEKSRALEAFFKHTYTCLVFLDPDFNFIRVNEAYARACQRRVSEFPGHNHFEFYPSEENESIFRDVVRTKRPFHTEAKPFEFPDHPEWGVTYWDWSVVPILDDAGNVELVVLSLVDVTERKRSEKQLRATNEALKRTTAQLRLLAWELTRTEQQERRRLAQVLHDQLQQILVAATLEVEMLRTTVKDSSMSRSLEKVVELLDQSISESRSLTLELSPPVLYDSGLAAALKWLARQMQEKHRLTVGVDADPRAEPSAEHTRVILFQSVRELLFNVVKHAHADRAGVRMARDSDDSDSVEIVVVDEGVGFDPAALEDVTRKSFGLFSIRERLGMIGGGLQIDSAPGRGTRVQIRAPRHGQESGQRRPEAQGRMPKNRLPSAPRPPVVPDQQ